MLNNSKRDVLMAFASLKTDPRFIKILDYLKEELQKSDANLRLHSEDIIIGRQQGCSLTLQSLIEKAQTSTSVLNSKN